MELIAVMLSDVPEMILGHSSKRMSRVVGQSRILEEVSVRMAIVDI